jgi:hypothetical protein
MMTGFSSVFRENCLGNGENGGFDGNAEEN